MANLASTSALPPMVGGGSKRDQKRRAQMERLETRHAERWYKRDEIYNEAITKAMADGHQLARDPASVPALGIPLYLLDLQRDAELESITIEWRSRLEGMQRAYEAERSKIEDDCRRAREAARQRCLDQIEERRRKVKEDKESTGDVVTEALLEAQVRPRPTRSAPKRKRSPHSSSNGTPEPSNLAAIPGATDTALASLVAKADALLSDFLPPALGAISTDGIISPVPYSLAILPAPPSAVDKGGKPGRRPGRGLQPLQREDKEATADLLVKTDQPGVYKSALTGYQKVTGWAPGKSLEELGRYASVNEMERESDLSKIKGYGRRKAKAGGA